MAAGSRVYKTELVLGIFLIASLGILAYLAMQTGAFTIEDRLPMTLVFEDAAGIVKDSAVMVSGVQVGRVRKLNVSHDKAIVHAEVNRGANIRKDVKALIRARSLLGEKYVELKPQSETAQIVESGFQVSVENTGFSTEIDQLTTKISPLIDKALVILEKIDPPPGDEAENLLDNLTALVTTLAHGLDGKSDELGSLIVNLDSLSARLERILARNETRIDRVLANLDTLLNEANEYKLVFALNDLTMSLNPVLADIQNRQVIPKLSQVLTRLDVIAERAEHLDEMAIRKFLQDEGIKIHIRAY
jgi:phospholipid/cholesterol/gamma-HCH transport system substrate-binding protein